MFFVGVGLVILFASFFIALVSLIREQGQRSADLNTEDGTLALETLPVEEETLPFREPIIKSEDISKNFETVEPSNLEETVPFPWEVGESEVQPADSIVYREEQPQNAFNIMRDSFNLNTASSGLEGEIYLRDLRNND